MAPLSNKKVMEFKNRRKTQQRWYSKYTHSDFQLEKYVQIFSFYVWNS